MRVRIGLILMVSVLSFAPAASAQDFGVLESAETINPGNFKLGAYPLFTFPDGADNEFSFAVAVGYGFTSSFDLEARAAFSDDVTFIGADGEYGFLKNQPLDMSVRGGFHFGFVDGEIGDSAGVDVSLIASAPVAPRIELIGALDLAFNSQDIGPERDGYTTVHLVPGVEIAVTPNLDFVGEFGIGVSDSASHYLGFGLAYYIR